MNSTETKKWIKFSLQAKMLYVVIHFSFIKSAEADCFVYKAICSFYLNLLPKKWSKKPGFKKMHFDF